MNTATPAVITAALGLLAGYDSAGTAAAKIEPVVQNERHQDLQKLADEIHSVIRDADELESTYSALIRRAEKGDIRRHVSLEDLPRLEELLNSLRGVEAGLKHVSDSVPAELLELHAKVRRSVARGRSKVAAFHSLAMQAYTTPTVFESRASSDAIRALAEYSTSRLVVLASA